MMKPKPIAWRAYQVTIPKVLADRLDEATDRQSRRENRAVSISEMCCWLLMNALNDLDTAIEKERHDGERPDA